MVKEEQGAASTKMVVNEDQRSGRIFIVSDLHLDHANIIKYCHRPFDSVHEMNDTLIGNWNDTVSEYDLVYYLGDMIHSEGRRTIDFWLSKLNGRIRFIRGNHDKDVILKAEMIKNNFPITYKGHKFLLMHDPTNRPTWDGWIIHGHMHNNNLKEYPHINIKNKTINVSVELIRYTPISMDEIVAHVQKA